MKRSEQEDMEPVGVRLTKQQKTELNKLINSGEYPTVSEAVRDAVRKLIKEYKNRGTI